MNGVTGLIIPLESRVIDRVFHHRPLVAIFVENFPSEIAVGDTAFLYASGGMRVLEGEGVIDAISREQVQEVRRRGGELSLSAEELDRYAAESLKSSSDEMLVLRVGNAVKYARPLRCSMRVRSGGEYMTPEAHARIASENS